MTTRMFSTSTLAPPASETTHATPPAANDNDAEPLFGVGMTAADRRLLRDRSRDWMGRAAISRAASAARSERLRYSFVMDAAAYPDVPLATNNNVAWPLAAQLKRDGLDAGTALFMDDPDRDLLSVAERYRQLFDLANQAEQFGASEAGLTLALQQKLGDKTDPTPQYKGALVVRGAPVVGDGTSKATTTSSDDGTAARRRSKPVAKRWNGDHLINGRIDARKEIEHVHSAIGAPLVGILDDACVYDLTLTEIGEEHGIGQAASGAGKALAYLALRAARDEFQAIDTERRRRDL
jgi:hypothetical protein